MSTFFTSLVRSVKKEEEETNNNKVSTFFTLLVNGVKKEEEREERKNKQTNKQTVPFSMTDLINNDFHLRQRFTLK